jgi:mannose-6-phosphate isomerase-like protein (cupin superfamily)
VASLNGQEVKLVKVKGTFPWHRHEGCEELFLVWRGRFRVEFRDHAVEMEPGQMVIVPSGVEHRTAAEEEAEIVVFERAGMVNTGDAPPGDFTAPSGIQI